MNSLNHPISESSDGWVHLVPLGVFPHPESGKQQVIDNPAIDAMERNFKVDAARPHFGGLLVDRDHFSYDLDKPSEAYGWLKELQRRPDGLWGRVEFTDEGAAAVRNRRYKFVSPVFDRVESLGGDRVRPLRIDSVGVTNNPNIKGMIPMANRGGVIAATSYVADPDPELPRIAADILLLLARRETGRDFGERLINVQQRCPLLNRAANHEKLYANHSYHHCIALEGRDQVLVTAGATELRQRFAAADRQAQSCRTDLPFYSHPSQLFEYAQGLMNDIRAREGVGAEAAFARLEEIHPLLYVNLCLNQRLGKDGQMSRLSF